MLTYKITKLLLDVTIVQPVKAVVYTVKKIKKIFNKSEEDENEEDDDE